jgi:hypothetical protein
MQKSEKAIDQRSTVLQTSGNVYQQSFAVIAFVGLVMLVLGAVILFKDQSVAGAILLGIGVICVIRAIGLARASKSFKTLAAEDGHEATES